MPVQFVEPGSTLPLPKPFRQVGGLTEQPHTPWTWAGHYRETCPAAQTHAAGKRRGLWCSCLSRENILSSPPTAQEFQTGSRPAMLRVHPHATERPYFPATTLPEIRPPGPIPGRSPSRHSLVEHEMPFPTPLCLHRQSTSAGQSIRGSPDRPEEYDSAVLRPRGVPRPHAAIPHPLPAPAYVRPLRPWAATKP